MKKENFKRAGILINGIARLDNIVSLFGKPMIGRELYREIYEALCYGQIEGILTDAQMARFEDINVDAAIALKLLCQQRLYELVHEFKSL